MPESSEKTPAGAAPHLLVERVGAVLVCTMNRPERKNALSPEMLVRLYDAWCELDQDPGLRVAVLTGGRHAFCAGADLSGDVAPPKDGKNPESQDPWGKRFAADHELQWKALLRNWQPCKPIVAAVEGAAVAGGTEILQGTDIRVAGKSAKFGVAEARWSLYPLGGSVVRLRRQIPYTLAAEMLLTGRHITAEEALRFGLIGHVAEDGGALDKAMALAEQVASNGPLAVQAILKTLRETESMPESEARSIDMQHGLPVFHSEDAKEGPRAFIEKRKPVFRGK